MYYDTVGKAVIKVEGAAIPISWVLKDSNGNTVTEGEKSLNMN